MKPEEIRKFLLREFPQLVASPRHRGGEEVGWSFFYGKKGQGNRIIRAIRRSNSAGTKLLLSISNRLEKDGSLLTFDGNQEQLRQVIATEIRQYLEHFSEAS